MTNIFLIGFMGSGKTAFGKKVAKQLGMKFVDLDVYITTEEKNSISSIFEKYGEDHFRNLETNYLKSITSASENTILSLGGGTPCFNNNLEIIKKAGKSVYLSMPVAILTDRLANSKISRPLIDHLKDKEPALEHYIEELLTKREIFYNQADLKIVDYWLNRNESIEKIGKLKQSHQCAN